ncbi:hypothetical protein DIPPA_18592 [Diplonema papillatum]|nr:hypothetical protein DIPPA_18592 [Diplonema papillatum]
MPAPGAGRRPLADVITELVTQWSNEMRSEAEAGDEDAMFKLANYYLVGWGDFDQSREDAIIWLRMLAKRDHSNGKALLARVLNNPDMQWRSWTSDD